MELSKQESATDDHRYDGAFDSADLFPQQSDALASGPSGAASASKPVATIPQLANYLINGYWQDNGDIAHHWGTTTVTYNINALNTAERFLAQSALNAWHEVANINFVLTTGAANLTYTHSGTMTAYESDSYTGSGITTSATINISTDWVTSDGGAYDGATGIDSYSYQTYLHETGHALGLGHQGNYNGSATYSSGATYANDTWQYSIMSYFSQPNYNGGSYRYVVTPQMADIYAVQSIYGAASTRTGDTVYGFHNSAGSIFDFSSYAQAPALTIYDSGGTDTLDFSGYSSAQTIDLRAGNFSSVGGLVRNIGIATNTTMERAIGGSGNDTLIANNAGCWLSGGAGSDTLTGGSGADRLIGGTGVDTMFGGLGADIFTFLIGDTLASASQHDLITDFLSGTDFIDLTGYDAVSSTAGTIDSFRFLDTAAFDGRSGVLNYFYDSARARTVLQGDTNGDRVADFGIDISGNMTLQASSLLGVVVTPVILESNGSTYLTRLGPAYYLNNTSGVGPTLKVNGVEVVANQFGSEAPIAAEAVSGGYQVVWRLSGTSGYTVWRTDSNGNFISSLLSAVPGTDPNLQALEPTFQQDLNGDGTIGIVSTQIEASGSTILTQSGNRFYLLNGSGVGPTLKVNGVDVIANQYGAEAPIAAEAVSGGYQVVWRLSGTSGYTVWRTDSNGNFISSLLSTVAGTDPSLQALETTFNQDLNGDGTIGIVATTVEANGSTTLTRSGNNLYLLNGSGAGPSLKVDGVPVLANKFAETAIAAEAVSGGYQVVWRLAGGGAFTVWRTDSNGNFLGTLLGGVAGTDPNLQALEPTFQQDLNGDGTIGIAPVTIESNGVTDLRLSGGHFYLLDGAGAGPSLRMNGAEIVWNQYGSETPIAAEQVSGGYDVVWRLGGNAGYTVWRTDSGGNFVGSLLSAVAGTDPGLQALEPTFQQDLNGDGTIGIVATQIEANGATTLSLSGGNFYFLDNTGTGPVLRSNGAAVVASQFAETPFAAEAVSGGYEVVWRLAGNSGFTVWRTDSSGNFTGTLLGGVAGTDPRLQALEPTFHQDLNGDGTVGIAATQIEANGATTLSLSGGNFYFLDNTGAGPVLRANGAPVVASQFAETPFAAEAVSGGYDVAWRLAGGNGFTVWRTDSNGNFTGTLLGGVPGTDPNLQALEPIFQQALTGDGTIGQANAGVSHSASLDALSHHSVFDLFG